LPGAAFCGIFFGGEIVSAFGATVEPVLTVPPQLLQLLQVSQQSPPRLNFFFRRPSRLWPLSQQSLQVLQLLVQVVVVQVLHVSQLW